MSKISYNGLTLVEMVVSIAIIGLVMALVLPAEQKESKKGTHLFPLC